MTTHWSNLGGGQPSNLRGPLTRPCPRCGAKTGEKCRDLRVSRRYITKPHRERKKESGK